MFTRVMIYLSIFIMIVAGCSSINTQSGAGGKSTSKKIEKSGHPDVPEGVSCFVCHKDEIPKHEFHNKYSNRCDQCHVKTTWMAKNYPHTEWPLNEIHNVRCTRCHTGMAQFDFKTYRCYGCHHEKEAIEKTHAKLKTDDVSKCVSCHKTSEVIKSDKKI